MPNATRIELQAITLREIALPLKQPFTTAAGSTAVRRSLLLELEDRDGIRVWSECVALAAPDYLPETIDTAWWILERWIAPAVLGRSYGSPSALFQALEHRIRGHQMAKAAIEMGAWALLAERQGRSLAAQLGGERRRVAAGLVLGMADSDDLIDNARRALLAGYHRLKVKIAPGRDLEPLRRLRAALGPDAPLAADANHSYRPEDLPGLRQLDRLGLELLEQPLAWDDLLRHADLQRQLTTPICLDESVTSVARAEEMLHHGSARVLNLKPGKVGGFTPSLEIHRLCRHAGVPIFVGGMLETGIGRAYNVALASLPGISLPGDLSPSGRYWRQDIVQPEWTMDRHGHIAVPTGPGLGVEIDRPRIEELTVRLKSLGSG